MTEKTDNETTATLYQECVEKTDENTTVEGYDATQDVPKMDIAQSEEVLPASAVKKEKRKTRKKLRIILCIVLPLVIIAAGVSALFIKMSIDEKETLKNVDTLIAEKNYGEAWQIVVEMRETKKVEQTRKKITDQSKQDVIALLSQDQFIDAYELLDSYPWHPEKTEITEQIFAEVEMSVADMIETQLFSEVHDLLEKCEWLPEQKSLQKSNDECFEEHVQSLIEDEDYAEAYEILEMCDWHSEYDNLLEDCYDAFQDSVYALMDEGNYIKAEELLKKLPKFPDYDKLYKTIVAEGWILTSVLDIRPYYKNPNSVQITSVEMYEASEEPYPYMLIKISAQNGFGGYGLDYNLFSSTDLSYMCSTSSLSDPDSDEVEATLLILLAQALPEINDYPYDINRINKLLSQNITPNIFLRSYEKEYAPFV